MTTTEKYPCTCNHEPDRHYETIAGCRSPSCTCAASARAIRAKPYYQDGGATAAPAAPDDDHPRFAASVIVDAMDKAAAAVVPLEERSCNGCGCAMAANDRRPYLCNACAEKRAAGVEWGDLPRRGDRVAAAPAACPRGYEHLAQLALAATPAPWDYGDSTVITRDPATVTRERANYGNGGRTHPAYGGGALIAESMREPDAAFVAAANPRQVLDLLGELAEAQEDAQAARAEVRRSIETIMRPQPIVAGNITPEFTVPAATATATATALEATMLARDEAEAKHVAHIEDCPRCNDVGCAFEPCSEVTALEEAYSAAERAWLAAKAASRAAYRARRGLPSAKESGG